MVKKIVSAAAPTPMNFGAALDILQKGQFVARSGWNGKNMHLGLQNPDAHSANTLPYIYMVTADRKRVPWIASHTDMLSPDWYVVAVEPTK